MEINKKELLDNLTKTKSSYSNGISKGHTVMPKADGKQLIVGKNIKLSGAIDVCESLAPALSLSQHQGLFKQVSSSHQVAKIVEFHLQHQFFQ